MRSVEYSIENLDLRQEDKVLLYKIDNVAGVKAS